MPKTAFEAMVRHHDGHTVIDLSGDIDRGADAALTAAYDRALAAGGDVQLNFAAVDYINSTGIALIVGLLARAHEERRHVSAAGLSAHYREIFEITRLCDFIRIVD
jgi:anti-sigma B factor antagonist